MTDNEKLRNCETCRVTGEELVDMRCELWHLPLSLVISNPFAFNLPERY